MFFGKNQNQPSAKNKEYLRHTTTAEYQVFNVAVSKAETNRCLP